ncbi:hypothetical protein [Streptomyces fulvoviolaceus]|uniref:hypothetical protein n=1 Tax=Streptomyces fulvoviolaceus TaxID=285535 RepID=UPI000AA05AEB|nr:hypothetical protein [Streptomyces fulvoviolaceus]MCT9078179.1 hypothetical protein [Streptomyces fulvoviolaceus]
MLDFALFAVVVVELLGIAGLAFANKKMVTDLPFRYVLLGVLAVSWGMEHSAESRTPFLEGVLAGVVIPVLLVRAVEYCFEQREESRLRSAVLKGAWVFVPLHAVCTGMFG